MRRLAAALCALLLLLGVAGPSSALPSGDYILIGAAELATRPTTGTEYTAMKARADATFPAVDFCNQDSFSSHYLVAAGYVYARTGITSYKTKVENILATVPTKPLTGGNCRVLSVARQVPGVILAADLVGYRTTAFVNWVSSVRTFNIGGGPARWNSIKATTENTPTNWGAWSMASRAIADVYLADTADLAKVNGLWTAWCLGDRVAYEAATDLNTWGNYFQPSADFDISYAHQAQWWAINPSTAGDKNGLLVEDISRSIGSYPTYTADGKMYSWEAINALVLAVSALDRHGYPDALDRSDNALLRATQKMGTMGTGGIPPAFDASNYALYYVSSLFGVTFPAMTEPAKYGRTYGFTDWLDHTQ